MLMGDLGAEGNEASKARLILMAGDMARRKGIDPALVCGLCEVESSWEPWAVRMETAYRWLLFDDVVLGDVSPGDVSDYDYGRDKVGYLRIRKAADDLRPSAMSISTELAAERTSWGLMQVMGAVARERGLKGWLTRLLQPEVNLSIGIKHLQWLAGRGWSGKDMISAYNQGSPRRHSVRRSGADVREYVNQAYVSKVLLAMREYQT